MAKYRRKCSIQMIILGIAGMAGLATLVLNYAAGNMYKENIQHRTKELQWTALMRSPKKLTQTADQFSSQTKVILMHSFPPWYELKSGSAHFSSCNYSCILTLDTELIEEVDSVILFSHKHLYRIPSSLFQNQIWIYFAVESPANFDSSFFSKPEWQHRFNWTMTYRRDSDFYFGYGEVVKRPSPLPARNISALVAGKSRMVAWFVSNCKTQSKRIQFVEALKEFIEVDIYGSCGNLKCGKERDQNCMDMLSKKYHFYLSFENAMCRDYITEKAYYTLKAADIVPVVRGGANYSALLPKHSFIDASKFPNVKALADYLKQVAGDRQLYQSYLDWKTDWQVIEPVPFSFCDLCGRLHNKDRWAKVYPNIHSWWGEGTCFDPPAIVRS